MIREQNVSFSENERILEKRLTRNSCVTLVSCCPEIKQKKLL